MSTGIKIRACVAALMVVLPIAAHADEALFQKPTALELFQLRSMCKKLGDAYEYGGKGATPEVRWKAGGMRDNGPEIHYNPKTDIVIYLLDFPKMTLCGAPVQCFTMCKPMNISPVHISIRAARKASDRKTLDRRQVR